MTVHSGGNYPHKTAEELLRALKELPGDHILEIGDDMFSVREIIQLTRAIAPRATLDEHCGHPQEQRSADGLRCLECGALV